MKLYELAAHETCNCSYRHTRQKDFLVPKGLHEVWLQGSIKSMACNPRGEALVIFLVLLQDPKV